MHRGLVVLTCLVLGACSEGNEFGPTSPAERDVTPARAIAAQAKGGAHFITPDGFNRRLSFTANQYADGSVDGQWQLVAGSAIVHGSITCLWVDGMDARVGGTVDDAKFTLFQEGTDIAWAAVDGGEGANAPGDATTNLRAFRNAPPGSAAAFCETGEAPPGLVLDEITRGNVQVRTF
jgi:hypothetical protein